MSDNNQFPYKIKASTNFGLGKVVGALMVLFLRYAVSYKIVFI